MPIFVGDVVRSDAFVFRPAYTIIAGIGTPRRVVLVPPFVALPREPLELGVVRIIPFFCRQLLVPVGEIVSPVVVDAVGHSLLIISK